MNLWPKGACKPEGVGPEMKSWACGGDRNSLETGYNRERKQIKEKLMPNCMVRQKQQRYT